MNFDSFVHKSVEKVAPSFMSGMASPIDKLYALERHPWKKTVTTEIIGQFFEDHLTLICRDFCSEELKHSLETLISRITRTFNNEEAKKIALLIRGALISMEEPPNGSIWDRCPKDLLKMIFSDAIVTDSEFNTLQKVCKRWNQISKEVWKDLMKLTWTLYAVNSIQWVRKNSDCKGYDFTNLKCSIQNKIFKYCPNVRELKICSVDFPIVDLIKCCPHLKSLTFSGNFHLKRRTRIDFTLLTKLRALSLSLNRFYSPFPLPPSIQKLKIAGVYPNLQVEDKARIKSLSVNCPSAEVDLSSPVWSEIESLKLKGVSRFRLPEQMEKLQEFVLKRLPYFRQSQVLDFSKSCKLKSVSIVHNNALTLKFPGEMPDIEHVDVYNDLKSGKIDCLGLSRSSKFKSLSLHGIIVKSLSLPESVEELKINFCTIKNWYQPHNLPYLKSITLNDVKGVPNNISLIHSRKLEVCNISSIKPLRDRTEINFTVPEEINGLDRVDFSEGSMIHTAEKSSIDESIFPSRTVKVKSVRSLNQIQFPQENSNLKFLTLSVNNKFSIQGLKRDFQSLKKLNLQIENLSDIDTIDLRTAKRIKRINIHTSSTLPNLKLPEDSSFSSLLELNRNPSQPDDLSNEPKRKRFKRTYDYIEDDFVVDG